MLVVLYPPYRKSTVISLELRPTKIQTALDIIVLVAQRLNHSLQRLCTWVLD